jgi:hypothetical protein
MNYIYENNRTFREDEKGNRELLANFIAHITKETRYVDGRTTQTVLTIEATKPHTDKDATEPIKLPPVEVLAEDFPTLGWVLPNWGVQAVVRPGSGIKDDLRTAIQLDSNPEIKTIHKHLGWAKINGKRVYLHAKGAVGAKGNDKTIEVKLPTELQRYELDDSTDPIQAIVATLALSKIAPPEVTWPLLAATFAPLFGPVDFAIHLSGRTGTFKSELMSLFQSHYGPGMDARHLPGSWSSTPNALEAQAFLAANAPFVVDDFVPTGSAWQQRAYQQNADKIIRAQGNQAGRARLTDTSNLQTTMYPRGVILSTGEDTPEGHSVRARMLILELTPGDIAVDKLSAAQANRDKYPTTTTKLIQHMAATDPCIDARCQVVRNANLTIGHTRTPPMLGRLAGTIEYVIDWAKDMKAIAPAAAVRLKAEAVQAILEAGNKQAQYLEATDPTDMFSAALRHVLAAGLGHLRTMNGGIPEKAEILGWTAEKSMGELATWKSHGPVVGWVNWVNDELFVDLTSGYNIIRKAGGNEITLTKQTMLKRLKDAGLILRSDDARQRNSIRITAEQHTRQVIALALSTTLEITEKP